MYTDALGFVIGAVLAKPLHPESLSIEEPHAISDDVAIVYSSKNLNERELKWSTTEKEALAIIHAVTVFRTYLYGRPFMVLTDHRPLEWLMSKAEPSGRLERWAIKLQEYDIKIGYRAGKSNQNADCLSRTPTKTIARIFPIGTSSRSTPWRKEIIISRILLTMRMAPIINFKRKMVDYLYRSNIEMKF